MKIPKLETVIPVVAELWHSLKHCHMEYRTNPRIKELEERLAKTKG